MPETANQRDECRISITRDGRMSLCMCGKTGKEMTSAIRNIAREQYSVVRHSWEYSNRLQEIYHAFSTERLIMQSTMACEDTLKPINEPDTLPKSETDKLIAQVPKEIRSAYTYNPETGHSILAIPSCLAKRSKRKETDYLITMLPRYVLEKGYALRNGYLYVDVKYDPVFGAGIPEEYFDYMEK